MVFSMKKKGPYTFSLLRLGGIVYLGMLEQFLIPKLDENDQEEHIHFQQDGAPPHYLEAVREYLNTRFSGRWIGRAAFPGSYTSGFFLLGIR
jgi:hypothetical protein